MMTEDQIIDEANRAWHENRIRDWNIYLSLLRAITGQDPLAYRFRSARDDVQADYEREAEAQGVSMTELLR